MYHTRDYNDISSCACKDWWWMREAKIIRRAWRLFSISFHVCHKASGLRSCTPECNSSVRAQLHLNKTKRRKAVARLSMRLWARRQASTVDVQQATLSTFSCDWRGESIKKKKRAAQRKRTKEATEAPDKKAIDSWMANAAQLWHCPNLAISFIGCQCPLLLQGAWHFSAQLANTLACSPIPLQGQWATHSSTHHTQKAFHMQQQQQQQQLGVWWKMQSWCCK